jgi:hypothetical protein|tara:strand:+ start:84 stop:257 length:174 start_codon:yes stop_codon:yes gene_type:complete
VNVRFWGYNPEPRMKRKRHTTEEIIRILRHADGEQTVEEFDKEYRCKLAPRYFRFSL